MQHYKIIFTLALLLINVSTQVFAINTITVHNESAQSAEHGPVIVLDDFNQNNGVGHLTYLSQSTPITFKENESEIFDALSSFHTLSEGLGHSLIAPHAIIIGNQTHKGKTNFLIQVMGRKGKTRIGPLSCSINKHQQCYEIPKTIVEVSVNDQHYPTIVNSGLVSLPAGNEYNIDLKIKVSTREISASPIKAYVN